MKYSILLRSILFICLTALCIAFDEPGKPTRIYVSPTGSDQNKGTKDAPYASLEAAKEAIAKLKRAGYQGTIEMIIGGGTYYLTAPLVWNAAESGTEGHPYIIKAAEGQQVIVSGGVRLQLSWEKYRDGVWKAKVPKGIIFESLFADGKDLVRARYPDYDANILPFNGYAADAISQERIKRWKHPEGGYVHALHKGKWGGFHYRIVGLDSKGELQLAGGKQNNRPSPMHEKYRFVENIFEELDHPGEWFLDAVNETLYYYPLADENISTLDFVAARLENLFLLKGTARDPVHDMVIQGIHFTQTAPTFMKTEEPLLRSDWTIYRQGAVKIEGAERCKIQQSDFYHLGGNAIFISNFNRGITISDNLIAHIGGGAINLVGSPDAVRSPSFRYDEFVASEQIDTIPGPKTNQYPARCKVSGNLIHDIGQIEKQVAGVQLAMAEEIEVEHNTIYNVPRAGINIGDGTWGGHLIAYNDVFNTVLETSDHGAFNSWGRDRFWHPDRAVMDVLVAQHPTWVKLDALKTTVIRNNRFRCDHGWDIDLDDGSSNYEIYNNLCLSGGLKLREGFYRKVYNNILLNNGFHPHVWFKNSHDVFVHNLVMVPHQQIGIHYWGDTVDYNFFANEEALKNTQAYGIERNGLFADVQFVDAGKADFRLMKNSVFLKKGFVNVDMNHFGVTESRLKKLSGKPAIPTIDAQQGAAKSDVRNWLGVEVKNIETLGEQSAAGLSERKGVLVYGLGEDNPLYKGGLRIGDVIMAIENHEIRKVSDLFGKVEAAAIKKRTMMMQLWRNQQMMTIRVTK